jgi:hypothetical protein
MASRTHVSIIVMMLEHDNYVNRLVGAFEQGTTSTNGEHNPCTFETKRQCIDEVIRSPLVQEYLSLGPPSPVIRVMMCGSFATIIMSMR